MSAQKNLATYPPRIETTAFATVVARCDTAHWLPPGQVPRAARTQLRDRRGGAVVPLPRRPIVKGTVIEQVLNGLAPGGEYDLVWVYRVGPSDEQTRVTRIVCVA